MQGKSSHIIPNRKNILGKTDIFLLFLCLDPQNDNPETISYIIYNVSPTIFFLGPSRRGRISDYPPTHSDPACHLHMAPASFLVISLDIIA